MAGFDIKCPHCGAELEVQDEWANMETACPACSKTFIIPARPEVRSAVETARPAAPPPPPPPIPSQPGDGECDKASYAEEFSDSQSGEDDSSEESGTSTASGCLRLISIGCWIVSIILYFCGVELAGVFFLAAIVLSVISYVISKSKSSASKFQLEPGEVIVMTCRLKDSDNTCYFVRVTNQRVVLSGIEYPLMPAAIASVIELMAKPTSITCSWDIADITSIEWKRSILFEDRCIITVNGEKFEFIGNSKLMKWWNQLSK